MATRAASGSSIRQAIGKGEIHIVQMDYIACSGSEYFTLESNATS